MNWKVITIRPENATFSENMVRDFRYVRAPSKAEARTKIETQLLDGEKILSVVRARKREWPYKWESTS